MDEEDDGMDAATAAAHLLMMRHSRPTSVVTNMPPEVDRHPQISSSSSSSSIPTHDPSDPDTARKRISRPLTGKHVRNGMGASPSTLVTLRKMIQDRIRLKALGLYRAAPKKGRRGPAASTYKRK